MSDLLSQASLVLIPSGYKEDIVYSEIPTDGSGDLTFTRASDGTRINSSGLVEVVPWNLVQQSNSFSTSPWFLVGTPTLTANYAANPLTGANDAWRFQSASSSERVVQSFIGSFNAFSLYAKGTGTIRLRDTTGSYYTDVALTSSWERVLVDIPAAFTNVQITSNGGCDATIYGAQLNIGSTAKPYFPTTDRLNVPRLTYQNGGGGCPSLLLEKQSTNLALQSQTLDVSGTWVSENGTLVSATDTLSPDGLNTAEIVTLVSGTANQLYQIIAMASGTTYNASIFLKNIALTSGQTFLFSTSNQDATPNQINCTVDLANGTITSAVVGAGVTVSNVALDDYGNGWYRARFTFSFAVGSSIARLRIRQSSVVGYNTAFYAWGAQLEASSYATSYIPTTSSSATRVADACYKTGISSLIGQTEGTMFLDAKVIEPNGTAFYQFSISDGTPDNAALIGWTTTAGQIRFRFENGGSVQTEMFANSIDTSARVKIAAAYKQNDFALYVNGTQAGLDTSGTIPSFTQMQFANGSNSSTFFEGEVNQAILFTTRLTNAELASITTI